MRPRGGWALFLFLALACGDADAQPGGASGEPSIGTGTEPVEPVEPSGPDEGEAAETSVPFQPSRDLPTLPSMNGAFFGGEQELRDAQTRYVQTRDCGSRLGANFALTGFSFIIPDDLVRSECDEEGLNQYVVFAGGDLAPGVERRLVVSGITGTVGRAVLEQLATTILRSALGPGGVDAELGESQTDSVEVHGSSLPRREIAFSFPDSNDGIQRGPHLAHIVAVARPFMRSPAGMVDMSPNQPGVVIVGIEPVTFDDLEAARERLSLGPTRLALHSLRFAVPEGFSPAIPARDPE